VDLDVLCSHHLMAAFTSSSRYFCVLNFTFINFQNTDTEFLREFLNFFRAQYPEVLAQLLIAPVGFFQRTMWNTFARFLDERRASRIRMVATMEDLRDYISEKELLTTHGGKNTWHFDPDNA